MTRLTSQIEEVLEEVETCELISRLAVEEATRQLNRERASELRRVAERAQEVDSEEDREGNLPDGRGD